MARLNKLVKTARQMRRKADGLEVNKLQVRLRRNGNATAVATVSGGSKNHRVILEWKPPAGRNKKVKLYGKQEHRMVGAARSTSEVRVWCGCDDFAYTFYPALKDTDSAYREVVVEKPKGTGRRRHIDEEGVCKHLMCLVNHLKVKGYFK